MGVPDFWKNIVKPIFGEDIQKEVIIEERDPSTHIDNLGIDANAIIHGVASLAFGYSKDLSVDQKNDIRNSSVSQRTINFNNMLIDEYRRITRAFKPKTLIVAHDGLVPAAKQKHQRTRRYRASILKSDVASAKASEEFAAFDNAAISAGTPFMEATCNLLRTEFKNNGAYYADRIIFVSHKSLGEGEHTMLELIRRGEIKQGPGRNVFYGMDSDWFFLSMRSGLQRVQVARESLRLFIDIDSFRSRLAAVGLTPDDFMLLCYSLGNDFLPGLAFMYNMTKSFRLAMRIHNESKLQLAIPDPQISGAVMINWPDMFLLFKSLAIYEPAALSEAKSHDALLDVSASLKSVTGGSTGTTAGTTPVESKTEVAESSAVLSSFPKGAAPLLQEYELQRSFWYIRNWRVMGDPTLFVQAVSSNTPFAAAFVKYFTPTQDRIMNMCRSYCDMIAWNFLYYTRGISHIRTDLYYAYYYAPLLYDLAKLSDYVPPPSNYSREIIGGVPRWELEHLIKSTLTDYEGKHTQAWINSSSTDKFLSAAGVGIAGSVIPKLFAKRLLTQLALVIPPGSAKVLSDKQRDICMNAVFTAQHPTNFKGEVLDVKIDKLQELEQGPRADLVSKVGEHERIIYLPNMRYNSTLATMIDLDKTDTSLYPEDNTILIFSPEERHGVKVNETLMNLSARGGRTPGLPAYGRGRGSRGGRGGRGRHT